MAAALIGRTSAAHVDLQRWADVTIGGTRGKKKARLRGRQAFAVHGGAGVGQGTRAAVTELIET